MKNTTVDLLIKTLFIVITLTTFSGCGTVLKKPEQLNQARQAIAQAEANPNTANSEALLEAKQALNQAEQSEDFEIMEHFVNVAKRQAQLALEVAKRQDIETETEQFSQDASTNPLSQTEPVWEETSPPASRQPVQTNRQLQQKLAQWQKTGRLVITLNNLFEFGKTDLSAQTQHDLSIIAAFVKKHPQLKISVEAHTDNTGTYQHNLGLSERQATSVKFFLIKHGISSKRILVKGFGATVPIASNSTNNGRQKNRRVELMIFNEVRSF
jgi:outer membrane protein OmpA-like peptidoglycan-associated protein